MYKKILIPLDGSENSELAIEHLKNVSSKDDIKNLIILRVVVPLIVDVRDYIGAEAARKAEESLEKEARDYINKKVKELKDEGYSVEGLVEVSNEPAAKIIEIAEKEDIDLLIMTTHGKSGFKKWILGNVTHKVLTHTPAPILIAVKKD